MESRLQFGKRWSARAGLLLWTLLGYRILTTIESSFLSLSTLYILSMSKVRTGPVLNSDSISR